MYEVISDVEKKKILEAETQFDAVSAIVEVFDNIARQYQTEMNNIHKYFGQKNISSYIEPDALDEAVYGTRQAQLYYEYVDQNINNESDKKRELDSIESDRKHDLFEISRVKNERINIINEYNNAYDKAKSVIEHPASKVVFDFVKNQGKIIARCEENAKNLPDKPDLSQLLNELEFEENKIKKQINNYYDEKCDEINKKYQVLDKDLEEDFKSKISLVWSQRKEREEHISNIVSKLLKELLNDKDIFSKFDAYMQKKIRIGDYKFNYEYEQLPENYDIGSISLKIPDVFWTDEYLRPIFKEISEEWSNENIITGDNRVSVPLTMSRRKGYAIVLPELDVSEVTSFVLRNSMLFPVGKMKFVAICAKSSEVFSPLNALQKDEHLVDNYHKEADIEKKIENLRDLVISYSDLFFRKEDIREVNEPFQTLMIYNYDNGFTDKAKRELRDMMDSAPKNGINCVLFCNNIEEVDSSVFGKNTFIVTANEKYYSSSLFTINYNDREYIYDMGDTVDVDSCYNVIRDMAQYIGRRNQIKYTIKNLLPDIDDANTYFAGGTTLNGIDVPIAFLGTEKFDFVIGRSANDDIRHYTLISGITGSGKSELLHTIVTSIMYKYPPSEVKFCMMDYKEGVGVNHFTNSPYVLSIIRQGDREAGKREFDRLVEEKIRRLSLFKTVSDENGNKVDEIFAYRRLTGEVMPKIIVIVDELSGLTGTDDDISKSVNSSIADLAQRGRAAGIHLILTSQTFGNTKISEDIKKMFVHRFECRGGGKATYTEYDIGREKLGEPMRVRNLDTVYISGYIDKYMNKIDKMCSYEPDETLSDSNTYVVSNIISDHTHNPLNTFDINEIKENLSRIYVGYNDDDDKIELNGSMLLSCAEGSHRGVMVSNAGSIITYMMLSILQNSFAKSDVKEKIISIISIETKDKYLEPIDKLRKIFPDYIGGIYAKDSDDDDEYDMHIKEIKNQIGVLYDEYLKRKLNNEDSQSKQSKYLVVYGLHRLKPLQSSSANDINTLVEEKGCISKLKELIVSGSKENIFVVAWINNNFENANKLFEESAVEKLFYEVMTSGIGVEKTKELMDDNTVENADNENYAYFRRMQRKTVYEIKLFEMPSDSYLDEFHDKCEKKFNI